jgi:DNA-directed RNA polymerase subunit beta
MSPSYVPLGTLRKDFSKIKKVVDLPNLIEIQRRSYDKYLQADVAPDLREDTGLQGVFKSVFPIRDFNQTASLEFVSYRFERPAYEVNECRERGMTYSAPLKVTVRLVVWDVSDEGGSRSIRDVKEQEVYFGEIPLMTDTGTFIINGTERVVVSQLHRSPGVFFEHDKGKTHSSGKLLYSARIIPNRGSWLDFEFDPKDIVYVRIDRRRKMPVTVLVRALGLGTEEILNYFYKPEIITYEGKNIHKLVSPELLTLQRATKDIKHPKTGELIVKKGRKFTKAVIEKLQKGKIKEIPVELEDLLGRPAAHDIVDKETGEVVLECNQVLTEDKWEEIKKRKIKEVPLLYIDNFNVGPYIRNTLLVDKVANMEESITEIYRRLRPGDPATIETATVFFENLFFNPERYDLSKVGRLKINHKFGFDVPLEITTLRKEDILDTVRYLVNLKDGFGQVDDIDHLGNRRVRAVGELLENQYRIGLVRMERAIKERMSLQEIETLMPHDLINPKPVSAVVKEFFGSSQLSQFMDQTNPLSEVTHKRRLSALGPGGLTRERAGFEVRDVHATHYGRICPIETPEGPNIGLIASLSSYARVNEFGFIETPYRVAKDGVVTNEVIYCSALDEEGYYIAQANASIDDKGRFLTELVSCRKNGEFVMVNSKEVELMDVSPNQLVSIAASLIPFLEHDDANRALMGSNMQRQAVPLLRSESPLVGTGVEKKVAEDSGVTIRARRAGTVQSVDATRIVVKAEKTSRKETSEVDIYNLIKYRRSNQNTCFNQKPVVKAGQKVMVGDTLADGPSTERGELALGQNVLVAFMPWGGYNFEDSILMSETLVKNDYFTSIHIEEFECVARDTKLGKEEITRDIPNVGEEALKDLDDSGIIRIGAEVKPGDILIGKITPKGETQLSPEEKLLRAIFGEKAGDVKDTSLRVPPGVGGIIIDAQVFSREGAELDDRAKEIQDQETDKLRKDLEDEIRILQESASKKIRSLLVGRVSSSKVVDEESEKVYLTKGKSITEAVLNQIPIGKWSEITLQDGDDIESELAELFEAMEEQVEFARMVFDQKVNKLRKGDELPPGVIKMVKVYVAIKRKISVGDKIAGRHGNKGVISRILPVEDMPYMEDGRPVDVVLNPLGVPSRMNVGQILEVHLGWAARGLGEIIDSMIQEAQSKEKLLELLKEIYGKNVVTESLDSLSQKELLELVKNMRRGCHMATPVFDGAKEEEIKKMLNLASLPQSGQTLLFDGRTGEAFEQAVTVGIMYILKLHHLVDDKIHARSIGPYSLVTQQPLGGKAQFGGQRLGEMEVWAMEAYGAAYSLQEFLTVKSDDVIGRTRMYEAIVKGDNTLEPGLPESFNVLMKELQSLALNVELIEDN